MRQSQCLTCSHLVDYIVNNGSFRVFREVMENSLNQFDSDTMDKIMQSSIDLLSHVIDDGCYSKVKVASLRVSDIIEKYCNYNKFSKSLAYQLFRADQLFKLYCLGKNCSGNVFVPEIGYYLYSGGDSMMVEWAKDNWPKDRRKYLITVEY